MHIISYNSMFVIAKKMVEDNRAEGGLKADTEENK
jgi:hypothetical protein